MYRALSLSRPFSLNHLNPTLRSNQLLVCSRDRSLLSLGHLRPRDGLKKKKRWGRGTGSGRGKMQGRGHQFSHATPPGFEGGQTPIFRRLPKFGMKNVFKKDYVQLNVDTIQQFIDQGRLVPRANGFTTMRDLMVAGLLNHIRDGVKLLARGTEKLKTPIHLEVTKATPAAIQAIEQAGGTVTCTYLSTLSLRALTQPYKFDLLPWRARPTPKPMQFYLDKDNCGYLAPEIQKRNLKLFGVTTSEKMYRAEHESYIALKRIAWVKEREEKTARALAAREKTLLKLEEKARKETLKQESQQ